MDRLDLVCVLTQNSVVIHSCSYWFFVANTMSIFRSPNDVRRVRVLDTRMDIENGSYLIGIITRRRVSVHDCCNKFGSVSLCGTNNFHIWVCILGRSTQIIRVVNHDMMRQRQEHGVMFRNRSGIE